MAVILGIADPYIILPPKVLLGFTAHPTKALAFTSRGSLEAILRPTLPMSISLLKIGDILLLPYEMATTKLVATSVVNVFPRSTPPHATT